MWTWPNTEAPGVISVTLRGFLTPHSALVTSVAAHRPSAYRPWGVLSSHDVSSTGPPVHGTR